MDAIESRKQLYKIIFDADINVSPQQRIKSFIDVLESIQFADFSLELKSAYRLQSTLSSKNYTAWDVQEFESLLNGVVESTVFNQ